MTEISEEKIGKFRPLDISIMALILKADESVKDITEQAYLLTTLAHICVKIMTILVAHSKTTRGKQKMVELLENKAKLRGLDISITVNKKNKLIL